MDGIISVNQLLEFKALIDNDSLFEQFCSALHLKSHFEPLRRLDDRVKIVLEIWKAENEERATKTALVKRLKGAGLTKLSDCLEEKLQSVEAENSLRLFVMFCHRTGLDPLRIANELRDDLSKQGVNKQFDANRVNVHLLSMADVAHDMVEMYLPPKAPTSRYEPDTLMRQYDGDNSTFEFDNNTTASEHVKPSKPTLTKTSSENLQSYACMLCTAREALLHGFMATSGHMYFKRRVLQILKSNAAVKTNLNVFIIIENSSDEDTSFVNQTFGMNSTIFVRIDNAVPAEIDVPRGTVSGSVFQNGFNDYGVEDFDVYYGHKKYNQLHRKNFTDRVKAELDVCIKELGYEKIAPQQSTSVSNTLDVDVDDDDL